MHALLLRFIGVLIAPFGLLCLLFPFAYLVWPDGPMLLDDTRGFFGAGTDEGVPVVHQVACTEEHYGGSGSRRGIPSTTEYQCDLMLSADPTAKEADSYAGMTYDESMKKFYESIRAQERGEGTFPDRITRTFASDVSSEPPPRLRLLSAEGVSPPRYAVIFDGGELASRWAHWFFMSGLMGGFACGPWRANPAGTSSLRDGCGPGREPFRLERSLRVPASGRQPQLPQDRTWLGLPRRCAGRGSGVPIWYAPGT